METQNYKTVLLRVKCNKCGAVVNLTAQEHSHNGSVNMVNHVNYCTCGVKFIEDKNGKGNFEYVGRVQGTKKKAKRYNAKKALRPIFDVMDDKMFPEVKNT